MQRDLSLLIDMADAARDSIGPTTNPGPSMGVESGRRLRRLRGHRGPGSLRNRTLVRLSICQESPSGGN